MFPVPMFSFQSQFHIQIIHTCISLLLYSPLCSFCHVQHKPLGFVFHTLPLKMTSDQWGYGSLDWCDYSLQCFPPCVPCWEARRGQRGGMEVREALQQWRKLPVASFAEPYITHGLETHLPKQWVWPPALAHRPMNTRTERPRYLPPVLNPQGGRSMSSAEPDWLGSISISLTTRC